MIKMFYGLTLMALISPCCSEVYDWNVKTVEKNQQNEARSDTDFDDDLRLQSALNSELQRDLLKISGKANENEMIYDNLRKFKYDVHKDKYSAEAVGVDGKKRPEEYDNTYQLKEEKLYNGYEVDGRKKLPEEYGNTYELKEQKLYNGYATSTTANIDRQQPRLDRYQDSFDKNSDNVESNSKGDHVVNKARNVKQDNIQDKQDDKRLQSGVDNSRQPNRGMDYLSNYNKYQLSDQYNIVHVNNNNSYHNYRHNEEENHEPAEHLYNDENNCLNCKTHKDQQYHNIVHPSNEDNKQNNGNNDKNINYHLMSRCPTEIGPTIENFLGANLFGNTPKKCFSADDIQLLIIRKDFESLMPKDLPQCLLNDRMIAVLMNYFYVCQQLIAIMTNHEDVRDVTQQAFFDTLGGYLNYYLVPVAKYSYYAGLAGLQAVQNILGLHQQCKNMLNTNGNGWKAPLKDVLNELKTVHIEPLHIEEDKGEAGPLSSCMHLDMDTDQHDDKMIVPLPKLEAADDNAQLGNVWLPLRHKRTFDLKSSGSAYVIVKFYETLSKCYRLENINQDYYNRKLREWFLENIQIHLSDEAFYPGLGAALRILETLRRSRKKVKFGDNLWEADYEDEDDDSETREKKDSKSKEFLDILKEANRPKTWPNGQEDAIHLMKVNSKLRKAEERDNKAVENPEKHHKPLTDEQINRAAEIIEERAKTANAKEQWRIFEMTPLQLIIIVIPVVVLIAIIIVCCLKFKKKKKKQVTLREYGGGGAKRRSKNGEETQLLSAQSKSVVHGNNSNKSMNRFESNRKKSTHSNAGSTGSSSSSLLCQFPAKCFAIKRTGPAIIETTSLDYSSSEVEVDTNTKNAFAKTVKIDEKSAKSASLNGRENDGTAPKSKDKKKTKEMPKK